MPILFRRWVLHCAVSAFSESAFRQKPFIDINWKFQLYHDNYRCVVIREKEVKACEVSQFQARVRLLEEAFLPKLVS